MTLVAPPSAMGHTRPQTNATGLRWAALSEAGIVVCALAGLEPERPDRQLRNLPALLRDTDNWRRELATSGIDDLAAMVEIGLAALLAINARGADCRAAARALWQEYTSARAALIALLPAGGQLGPLRSA